MKTERNSSAGDEKPGRTTPLLLTVGWLLCVVEVVAVVPVKFWVLDMPVWTSNIWLSVSRNEGWFTMVLTMLLMSGKLLGLPGLPSSMLLVANTEICQPQGLFASAQVHCASSIYLYNLHFIPEKAQSILVKLDLYKSILIINRVNQINICGLKINLYSKHVSI